MSPPPAACDDPGMASINRLGWETTLGIAEDYAARHALRAPLDEPALRHHAEALVRAHPDLRDSPVAVALMLHNVVSAERVRAIPPARRLLLLPRCLRSPDACRGTADAAGLLCARCGRCCIQTLLAEAEATGCVTLVTEGATLVRQLIASGRIGAVIGVGCIESLERLFPDLLAHDVPGLAVPLRRAGCEATEVDVGWVLHLLRQALPAEASGPVESIEEIVRAWFTPEALTAFWRDPALARDVERRALEAITTGGNRWRPYLAVAVFSAIRGRLPDDGPERDALRTLALAVECFHKASLVHDDIEDDDDERYGRPTLHRLYGAGIAINVGDYLIGEGYRLLDRAAGGLSDASRVAMLQVAIAGHRTLCLGQGDELAWTRSPGPLLVEDTLAMLTDKSAPAFEVALLLGARMAAAPDDLCAAISRFSRTFGRAFQIRDDLSDFEAGTDLHGLRPNLVLALLCASGTAAERCLVSRALSEAPSPERDHALQTAARRSGAVEAARRLLDGELHALHDDLEAMPSRTVARWLRQITERVFGRGAGHTA